MLVPFSWLKEYIPTLPPVDKLADILMMHGLEVESVIDRRAQFEKVVVGEIVHIKAHPNADKLRLADVMIAPQGKPQEIVCGAPNIAVGQKVPVALVGARLPKMTIEPREIRGMKSNGMICAEDELGLGTSHAGVMILDPQLKVGTPFAQAMGFNDVILDIATPANRADLMSMRGLAWEIAAMLGKTAKFKPVKLQESKSGAAKSIKVKIVDPKLCSVLTARVIHNITLKPTPVWMVQRLRAAGMRSVNIIVDITNYVMLEYGQPLHAYDADQLQGGTLIARRAKSGEHLETLDGQTRNLQPDMLVITDANRPVDLAGVMGGKNSEVTATTKNIVFEAAVFNSVSVRRTSRSLGLLSEASKRFEKGLWPNLPSRASAAAAALVTELCGGTVAKGIVQAGTKARKPVVISFQPAYVGERLGMNVPATKIKTILAKLGFGVKGTTKIWKVTVPEWRLDVSLREDLVDEVGRIVGYEKLPAAWPTTPSVPGPMSKQVHLKDEIRQYFAGQNFVEVITHAYYGSSDAADIKGQHIQIANPLDKTQEHLRRSMIPAVKKILMAAVDAGEDARIFEIGRVFHGPTEQPWKLAFGVTAKLDQAHQANELVTGILDALGQKLQQTTSVKQKGRVMVIAEIDVHPTTITFKTAGKFPAIKRDISFWLKDGQESQIGQAVASSHVPFVTSLSLKDKFSKDRQTSYTITLTFQAEDRALNKNEVDVLEVRVKKSLESIGAKIR